MKQSYTAIAVADETQCIYITLRNFANSYGDDVRLRYCI